MAPPAKINEPLIPPGVRLPVLARSFVGSAQGLSMTHSCPCQSSSYCSPFSLRGDNTAPSPNQNFLPRIAEV